MTKLKISLLATGALFSVLSTSAFAQTALPLPAPDTNDGALHGAGSSAVSNLVPRNQNCIGPDKKLGKSSSLTALSTISPGNYAGAVVLDCSLEANNIQPNQPGEYVSTGSGFGRTMWSKFGDVFDGAAVGANTGVFNPFQFNDSSTPPVVQRWNHLQYAFSDAGLGQGDFAQYNAGGGGFTSAASQAGPAVTFPLFVLPVAIAYDATYGVNAANHAMVFNAQGKGINATNVLNLSRAVYCGIFNGDIKNWNDASIQALNGVNKVKIPVGTPPVLTLTNIGVPLYDNSNDTATRWAADGAPIRLVGRLDKSGTTDVFTRHLVATCTSANGYAGTNKYLQHAETLPYGTATGLDFRPVRGDVNYFPTVASSKLAGTTNMVSAEYFSGSAIVNIGGATSSPTGNVGSGLYLLADGNGKVASALVFPSDYTLNGVKLNGKVGYISADFIQPSVDAPGGLNAASLQTGPAGAVTVATKYLAPTVKYALAAFTQLPPEAGATGAYTAGTDTRLVNPASGSTKIPATRTSPLAWVDVLYADSANTLAAPTAGYPIVGTTQFFGYTCYTPGSRQAVVEMLAATLGQIKKDSNGNAIGKKFIGDTSAANPGVDVQSNIGIVPAAWQFAITNTFLSKGDAGALNLYIQDAVTPVFATNVILTNGIPRAGTTPAVAPVKGLGVKTPTFANPACSTTVVVPATTTTKATYTTTTTIPGA